MVFPPLTPHFRFGHSLLKPTFKRMDTKYADAGPALKLADMFFNPESLHEPGMLDDLMRGMSATSMETLDQVLVTRSPEKLESQFLKEQTNQGHHQVSNCPNSVGISCTGLF